MAKEKKINESKDEKSEKDFDEFRALVKRTDKENPKPEDLKALKKAYDEMPGIALATGNLKKQVFTSMLEKAVGKSAYAEEAAKRYIAEMKKQLGYDSSTFIEKMLIDEIVLRWLRLTTMDNDHWRHLDESHSFAKGIYYDKRLHLTQKRYLTALETLAKVRKLIAGAQAKGAKMFKNLVDAEKAAKTD